MERLYQIFLLLLCGAICWMPTYAQDSSIEDQFTIGRLKYDGGGDWYSDPTSLPNLLEFLQLHQ